MNNPFDDKDGLFHVLRNHEGQYSLWPASIKTPEGWSVVLNEKSHATCLEYVDQHWTDMRPKSLIDAMNAK